MTVVAALLDNRAALGALRRSLPPGSPPVLACRSTLGLTRAVQSRLLEAVVVGTRMARKIPLDEFQAQFPGVPVVIYGVLRPEDAGLLLYWHRREIAAVVVEGVEDALAGDLVMRRSQSATRSAALAEAPRLLRLTEPLQRKTWDLLVRAGGRPPRTAALAKALEVSREHLSRQFGAAGAPNLKRVSDLLSVLAALALLRNPGHQVAGVAGLLGFSTPSHLRATVRRITGLSLAEAESLTDREVLSRFLRTGARSRS